jgi:hypothetical protein
MKPQSQAVQSRNINQLSAFRNFWRESSEYPEENRGNDRVRYPVRVEYEVPTGGRRTAFETTFTAFVASGPDDGMVDLDETDRVSIDKFHLRFLPAFQVYSFDNVDSTFIVTGISKRGESYRVVIRPTIAVP